MTSDSIIRLLFWLLLVNFSQLNIIKDKITCNVTVARSTDSKQRWNVSCFFPQDLRNTGESFAVFHYSLKGTAVTIYPCNFLNQRPVCEGGDGVEPPQTASSEISMVVPSDDDSYFECNTIPSKEFQTESCTLSSNDASQSVTLITGTTTERVEYDGDGTPGIGVYVLGAFACVLLLLAITAPPVIIRRRRANRSLRQDISTPGGEFFPRKASMRSETGSQGEERTLLVDKAEKPEWCCCGHCVQMPTEPERICCSCAPCLSTSQKFLDILEEVKAWEPETQEGLHGNVKETRRWRCYNKFVEWHHGDLGEGHKCPIYSCCVWAIRNTFPEEDGKCTGHVEGSMVAHGTKVYAPNYEPGQASEV